MFFQMHPIMVQIMSIDIKFHQISNNSKHMQCFDIIGSDKVHYHLNCRKYSDNSGDHEIYYVFPNVSSYGSNHVH